MLPIQLMNRQFPRVVTSKIFTTQQHPNWKLLPGNVAEDFDYFAKVVCKISKSQIDWIGAHLLIKHGHNITQIKILSVDKGKRNKEEIFTETSPLNRLWSIKIQKISDVYKNLLKTANCGGREGGREGFEIFVSFIIYFALRDVDIFGNFRNIVELSHHLIQWFRELKNYLQIMKCSKHSCNAS